MKPILVSYEASFRSLQKTLKYINKFSFYLLFISIMYLYIYFFFAGETKYLKEVYAAQLNSLRPKLEAMASKSSSGGAGGGGLNLALKMFGNKMTKELLA